MPGRLRASRAGGYIVMSESDAASRYRANLRGEVDSASLYRTLAETESDPHLAEVYRRLAAVEEAHAEFW
jgi:vacuolar iron transporter family protein